jgi:hypothetical protein
MWVRELPPLSRRERSPTPGVVNTAERAEVTPQVVEAGAGGFALLRKVDIQNGSKLFKRRRKCPGGVGRSLKRDGQIAGRPPRCSAKRFAPCSGGIAKGKVHLADATRMVSDTESAKSKTG